MKKMIFASLDETKIHEIRLIFQVFVAVSEIFLRPEAGTIMVWEVVYHDNWVKSSTAFHYYRVYGGVPHQVSFTTL